MSNIRIGLAALMLAALAYAAPIIWGNDKRAGLIGLIVFCSLVVFWAVLEAVNWAKKGSTDPRPRLSLHWVRNELSSTGHGWSPMVLGFVNEGDRIAENVRLVLDKANSCWLEQVGILNTVPLDGRHHQVFVQARRRLDDGSEIFLAGTNQDPVTTVLSHLQLANPPVLEIILEFGYSDSQNKDYKGRCRIKFDAQTNVICENIPINKVGKRQNKLVAFVQH